MIKLRVLQRHLSYYKHPIISQKMGHHPYISSDIETKEIEHRQIDKQTVDDQNATFCSFCFVVTWGPGQEDEAEVEQEITVVKVI